MCIIIHSPKFELVQNYESSFKEALILRIHIFVPQIYPMTINARLRAQNVERPIIFQFFLLQRNFSKFINYLLNDNIDAKYLYQPCPAVSHISNVTSSSSTLNVLVKNDASTRESITPNEILR